MANVTTGSVWVIDTAAADLVSASATTALSIAKMVWDSYTDKTHEVIVKDGGGRIIWQSKGLTDLPAIDNHGPFLVYGLRVTTLGSGQVNVYLE